ncbi:MAG: hypothetical protein HYZ37_11305 [Candidatus Solibacter usitatus]|nr:hypothetical protein [Candidatus Solibacter usitatus]
MSRSFALAILAANLTLASAQTWEFTPTAGYQRMSRRGLGSLSATNGKPTDIKFQDGYGYGLRLTMNSRGYYGHELGYFLNRPVMNALITPETGPAVKRTDRVNVQMAYYSFLAYMMPKNERWRPYLAGGGQMFQYGAPKFKEYTDGATRNYGGHFGAGIKLKLVEHLLLRMDFRDYVGGKPYTFDLKTDSGTRLHQFEGTLGVGFTF